MSNKIFIVTGELSGDRLAAWFLRDARLRQGYDGAPQDERQNQNAGTRGVKGRMPLPYNNIQAIGGDYLQAAGVDLYARFETLNVTGIVEVIKHIPRLLRYLSNLKNYILSNNFDEVILVDFPGFNLRLARVLKKQKPDLKITYLSPPQLWCWGAWRIKSLKKYCDAFIVLYPFEVAWYAKRGLNVAWLGNPVYEAMQPFVGAQKKNIIALLPGSRVKEIEELLPTFLKTVQILISSFQTGIRDPVQFVMPLSRSLTQEFLERVAREHGLENVLNSVRIISNDHEKYTTLAQCSAALSKPGTVTLELALLKVPTIIFYKTSWLTYALARLVTKVRWMGLPNLILNKELFSEVIQYNVTPENLARMASDLFLQGESNNQCAQQMKRDFADLEAQLAVSKKISIL